MNKQTNFQKAVEGLWKMNLNFYKKLYKKTVNPLLLWDLYRLARNQKKPIPEEVLTYFDSISKHLLGQNRSEKDALGLKGFAPGSAKMQYNNILRNMNIWVDDSDSREKGLSSKLVEKQLSKKYNLSTRTIRRIISEGKK